MGDVDASPSYAVNLTLAVAKRLHAEHECVCTLYCRNVPDDRSRVFAIVRNTHSSVEHGLFVFKFSGLKAMQSLKLLRAHPIIETTAIGYDEAGVIAVYVEGQLVEHAAAPVISECDEFAHQLLRHVYAAVLHQFRVDRTHGAARPRASLARAAASLIFFCFAGWCREYDCSASLPDAGSAVSPPLTAPRPPSATAKGGGRPKSWTEGALQRRLSEWANLFDVNIMCVTWNVAGMMPQQPEHFASLAQLLQLHDASLVALAFQEAVDLNASSLGIDSVTCDAQSSIDALLKVPARRGRRTCLWPLTPRDAQAAGSDMYVCVAARQLVGVVLVVIARQSIAPLCEVRGTAAVPCGVFNSAGNKGGVTCSVSVLDTSIAFVAVHLAGTTSCLFSNRRFV
jgi:hypothetical protein